MGTYTVKTSSGTNYNKTTAGSGSHWIGRDSGYFRAEVYSFKTGSTPVSKVTLNPPNLTNQSSSTGGTGSFKIGISTSKSTFLTTAYKSTPSYGSGSLGTAKYDQSSTTITADLAANTTYYMTFYLSSNVFSLYSISNHDPITLTLTEAYTNCTAPTTVSTSPSIIKPGGTYSLSWSGAAAGVNTPITGYEVFYKIGSAPTTSDYTGKTTVSVTTTTGSCNFTLPTNATRGNTLYYAVRTLCSESSYYSTFKQGSGGTVNRLPTAPTLSKTSVTLKSTDTAPTITATAVADSDSQSTTAKYRTSSSGSWTNLPSTGIAMNPSAGQTLKYDFCLWDGLEYGAVSSCTVVRNAKPVISVNTTTAISSYSVNGGDGIEGYSLGWVNAITPNITSSKGGTLSVVLEMCLSNDTAVWSTSGVKTYNLESKTVTASTFNLSRYFPETGIYNSYTSTETNNNIKKWRLKLVLNDGLENSDTIYYPASNKYYRISKAPVISAKYNRFDNSNIPGTIDGHISQKARFVFPNDTSLNSYSVVTSINGTTISNSFTTSVSGNNRYIDVTLNSMPNGNSTVDFSIRGTNTNISPSIAILKSFSAQLVEKKNPTLSGFVFGAQTVKPFTSNGSVECSFGWPFGSTTNILAALKEYEIVEQDAEQEPVNLFSLKEAKGNYSKSTFISEYLKSGDSLKFNFDLSKVFEFKSGELGISSYTGAHDCTAQMTLMDLYGNNYASNSVNLRLDFNEPLKDLTITGVEWKAGSSSYTPLQSTDKIQEGMTLRFKATCSYYTVGTYSFNLLKAQKGLGSYTTEKSFTFSTTKTVTGRTAQQEEFIADGIVIKEIGSNIPFIWKLRGSIANITSTIDSNVEETATLKHVAPSASFVDCTVEVDDDTGETSLEYSCEVTDNGGGSLVGKIHYDEEDKFTVDLTDGSNIGKIATPITWESKIISIKIVSTVRGLITTTKTYETNSLIVYKLSPTVSYRKNQLGVNTSNLDKNSIVTLYTSSKDGEDIKDITIKGIYYNWDIQTEEAKIVVSSNDTTDSYELDFTKIGSDILNLVSRVDTLETNVTHAQTSIATNTSNISTLSEKVSSIEIAERSSYYTKGDVIEIPVSMGIFTGLIWNKTQLRFVIPLDKPVKNLSRITASYDTNLWFNTWYYSGSKTIQLTPQSVSVAWVVNTSQIQVMVEYGVDLDFPTSMITCRIDGNASRLKLTFS